MSLAGRHAREALALLADIVELRPCDCRDCSVCAAAAHLRALTCGAPADWKAGGLWLCDDCAEAWSRANRRRRVSFVPTADFEPWRACERPIDPSEYDRGGPGPVRSMDQDGPGPVRRKRK